MKGARQVLDREAAGLGIADDSRLLKALELVLWGDGVLEQLDLECVDLFSGLLDRLEPQLLNSVSNVVKVLILGDVDVVL